MECKSCSAQIADNVNKCPYCGAAVAQSAGTVPTVENRTVRTAGESLGRLTPFAAFGFILCGVGAFWTWIEHFRYISLVNKLRPTSGLQWWPVFIPIYGNIYLTTMAKELNSFIKENNLAVSPAMDSLLLAFFFPFANWHSMFSTFNKCADAVGR